MEKIHKGIIALLVVRHKLRIMHNDFATADIIKSAIEDIFKLRIRDTKNFCCIYKKRKLLCKILCLCNNLRAREFKKNKQKR